MSKFSFGCGSSTYNGYTSFVGLGHASSVGGDMLQQEGLQAVDGSHSIRHGTHGLGQHHQGEAQNVEQGEGGEGQGGIKAANQHLIGGEDDTGSHRGCGKHHGDVDGLDDGILELQLQLTLADGGDLLLKESLPAERICNNIVL